MQEKKMKNGEIKMNEYVVEKPFRPMMNMLMFDDVSFCMKDKKHKSLLHRLLNWFKCGANPSNDNYLRYTLKQYRKSNGVTE